MSSRVSFIRSGVRRSVGRALPSVSLTIVILAGLVAGSALAAPAAGTGAVQASGAAVQRHGGATALYAVFLDEPERLAQAEAAGLMLYSHLSSSSGDYLLVGAAPRAAERSGVPLQLLDEDTTGAGYYVAYPPPNGSPVPWAETGRVLLHLGDHVLLRADPEAAERLPELGVEIVRIALEPQPWPAVGEIAPAAALLAITPDPNVQAMLGAVSGDTITTYTAQLSGVQPVTVGGSSYTITTRNTYSGAPIQKAGQFVGEHMQALGMNVEYHVWGTSGTPSTYPNVVGQITGSTSPADIYIIGAHLDDMPSSGAAPGADDNGSGSVGTLVAADILSQYRWNCTLRFAFWTGEEQGLLGSAAYATRAKNGGENIKGYLNMDMIAYNGVAPNEINLYAKSTVPGSVDLMNLYADAVSTYGLDLVPVKYTDYSIGNQSDNKSFWDKGYPSILAIEDYYGDFTPYYHKLTDTMSTLNMAYYTEFVKASLATFVHLTGCLITEPANQPPTADPQSVTTLEDASLDILLTGSDPEGQPLSYSVGASPSHGTLSGTAPALIYQPAANYNGTDSFTFTVSDGVMTSTPAAVSIDVISVNDAPVANGQSVTTQQDTAGAITLTGSDVDADPLTYAVSTPPAHGALSGTAPYLSYTPATGYAGPDSFTFTVSDNALTSSAATVSITVTPVNHPPVANAQAVTTAEEFAAAITLTGSDPDNDSLTFNSATQPGHGILSGTAPNLTYTPAANYNGPDSFTFVVSDGQTNSAPATVSITVSPVNDAPVANPKSVTTQQNTALAITLTGSDVEGDALTYGVVSGPSHGALSGTAPNLTYTPASGYSGPDSFTFRVNDGKADSALATVSITVNAAGPKLYLGSSTAGTAGGVSFADEDVLIKDMGTGAWSLFIDGSDIGLTNTDVDALDLQADGTLLMSFDTDFTLTGFGAVDDSDILRFIPTSTGSTTAGTWSWYFDGSDVGLTATDEDVDAFDLLPDGRLLVSTLGNVSVTGATGLDEDLLVFTPTRLGSTTSGTWAIYFDGSDVGLSTTANEDVNGAWVDAAGKIYLTTLGAFSVTGVNGDGSDIFGCTPGSLGSTTSCTWSMYWDGSVQGFTGEDTDSLAIVQ